MYITKYKFLLFYLMQYYGNKVMEVALARDFYVLNSINNDLLVCEIKQNYDSDDCVISKRELLFNQLLEKAEILACCGVKNSFIINFLEGVLKIFSHIHKHYVKTALEYKNIDSNVYGVCMLLAQNEYYNYLSFCSLLSETPIANFQLTCE